jgi:hypothetical protein
LKKAEWVGHEARIGDNRNSYELLKGNLKRNRPLRRTTCRLEDNINMHLEKNSLGE